MRKVVQDELFVSQLEDLEFHVPGVRSALTGLAFMLRTNPESGMKLQEDPPLWFVPLPDLAERALGITYTFNANRVVLLSIWIE
jgi:hypothetical protein